MLPEPYRSWRERLQVQSLQRRQQNLWRQPRVLEPGHLNFCSNDYLGLSRHPKVIAAFRQGLARFGCGSGGSPLLNGYQAPHHELSEQLADWLGRDAVLLTGSGYAANYAVANVLAQLNSAYYLDKSSHASMYDAIGFEAKGYEAKGHNVTSRQQQNLRRFRHNDLAHLAHLLDSKPAEPGQQVVIAGEGIYSMDGDALPLKSLLQLKQRYASICDPLIWVDDAHGIGVSGTNGAGVCAHTSSDDVAVVSATFGKAFGISGAFVAADDCLIATAWQQARHYIYSTAFSAAQAVALSAALEVIKSEPQHQQQLVRNITVLKQGLVAQGWRNDTQNQHLNHAIQPIVTGCARSALALSAQLAAQGIDCLAIRPPTVAAAKSGIRVTLRADHTPSEIARLLDALGPYEHFQRSQPVASLNQ